MAPFSNPFLGKPSLLSTAISDQVSRLCGDGVAKFEVYVVPYLPKMLVDGHDTVRLAFLLASNAKYLVEARTEAGEPIEIFEPHLMEEDKELIAGCAALGHCTETADKFLDLSAFRVFVLRSNDAFIQMCHRFYDLTVAQGLSLIEGIA